MALSVRGRWLVVGAALLVLGAAAFRALSVALADGPFFQASRKYQAWVTEQRSPSVEEWLDVRDALRRAAAKTPGDAAIWELLGLVHLSRSGPIYADLAYWDLQKAAALRPTSGYTWAAIAEAQYRLQLSQAEVERSLALAQRFGPREPEVISAVNRLAMARDLRAAPGRRSP